MFCLGDKKYLSAKEAAAMLSMSSWSVRRWMRSGQLPATEIGGRWFVEMEDFRKFIQGNTLTF